MDIAGNHSGVFVPGADAVLAGPFRRGAGADGPDGDGGAGGGPDAGPEPHRHQYRRGSRSWIRLPGIGEVLAGRIIAYREANGPFETVEDLLEVSGIGEAKLAELEDGSPWDRTREERQKKTTMKE